MTTNKEALEAAYLAGFNASGEGYNGEYPFGDNMQDPAENRVWKKNRDNYIKEALAKLDKIAALQQKTESHDVDCLCSDCAALDDLDEALAQPEQKPVQCWKCGDMDSAFHAKCDVPACGMKETKNVHIYGLAVSNSTELYLGKYAENDARVDAERSGNVAFPLYTTLPQRTWVGLTEDEAFACKGRDYFETYKAIEAKLKEKNT